MLGFLPFSLSPECFCWMLGCVSRGSGGGPGSGAPQSSPTSAPRAAPGRLCVPGARGSGGRWLFLFQHIKFFCSFLIFWAFFSPFLKTSSCESENVSSRWMCACMESLEQPADLSTRMGFLLRALTLCSCRESSFGGKGPASLQTSSSSFEQIKAAIPNQIQKDAFYGMLEKLRLLPTSSVYFSITGISLSLNEFSTNL